MTKDRLPRPDHHEVARLVRKHGLNATTLATHAGINRKTAGKALRGDTIRADGLRAIAEFFKVSYESLLAEDGSCQQTIHVDHASDTNGDASMRLPRNPGFLSLAILPEDTSSSVCRVKYLKILVENRTPRTIVLLLGPKGAGKTQIAKDFALNYHMLFSSLVWTVAGQPVDVSDALAELGERIMKLQTDEANHSDVVDHSHLIGLARQYLEHVRDWCFVLDGCDSPGALLENLRARVHGFVVVTTEHGEAWRKAAKKEQCKLVEIRVDPPDEEEAADMLAEEVGINPNINQHTVFRRICRELHCRPSSISRTGTYIRLQECSPEDYFKRVLTARKSSDLCGGSVDDAAVHLNLQAVHREDSVACDLLRFCSCFGPADIPFSVISHHCVEGNRRLQGISFGGSNGVHQLLSKLRLLRSWGLLSGSSVEKKFSIDPLVAASLRVPPDMKREAVLAATMGFDRTGKQDTYDNWRRRCERLLPHVRFFHSTDGYREAAIEECGRLFFKAADFASDCGRYKDAKNLFQESVKCLQDSDRLELARSIDGLGWLMYLERRYDSQHSHHEAEDTLRDALTLREEAHAEDDEMAQSESGIAWVLYSRGSRPRSLLRVTNDAIDRFRASLDRRTRCLFWNHPDVARSLDGLGFAFIQKGDRDRRSSGRGRSYVAAEAAFLRAIYIRENSGQDTIHSATSYRGMARVCQRTDRRDEARHFFERSVGVAERFAPDQPELAVCLKEYGHFLNESGEAKHGDVAMNRSHEILRRRTVGSEDV